MSLAVPSPDPSAAPEAIELLRESHRALREVFAQYRRVCGRGGCVDERERLARRACELVEWHARLDEELVYPATRPAPGSGEDGPDPGADALVRLGGVECGTLRTFVREVRGTDPREPRFDALVVALGQCVERRLAREEAGLFGHLRCGAIDLAELVRRLRMRREGVRPSGL